MRDLRVDVHEAARAADEPPGFFTEGKIKKLHKEYEKLHNEHMIHKLGTNTAEHNDPQLNDNTQPSITIFVHKFGVDNIAKAIDMLQAISGKQEETYVRIAHFFYHLGRRHERSIFK